MTERRSPRATRGRVGTPKANAKFKRRLRGFCAQCFWSAMRLRIAFIVHRYNGIDLRTPPAGPWSCFIPNHRWFAPPANIQHPSGIGFCAANKIVTALLPRGKTDVSIIHVIRVTCRGSRVGCNPSMSSQATRLPQRRGSDQKNEKKACHSSTHQINPGNQKKC